MLVLTSGYNRFFVNNIQPPTGVNAWYAPDSNEYVFVYDLSNPTPVQKQVVQVPAAYSGIAFDPSGAAFYLGGCAADLILVVARDAATGNWPAGPTGAISLGHKLGLGLSLTPNGATAINNAVGVYPCAAGVAVSNDGQTLVVANYYNESLSVFTGGLGNWSRPTSELADEPRSTARQERPFEGRYAGRRISILGAGERYRSERNSICVQYSRPRDRRRGDWGCAGRKDSDRCRSASRTR